MTEQSVGMACVSVDTRTRRHTISTANRVSNSSQFGGPSNNYRSTSEDRRRANFLTSSVQSYILRVMDI
jgi:hypothetical protein